MIKMFEKVMIDHHIFSPRINTCRQSMRQIRKQTLSKGMCSTIKPYAVAIIFIHLNTKLNMNVTLGQKRA